MKSEFYSFSQLEVAISQVSRTGRCLYKADGSRFYIQGVAYQLVWCSLSTDASADILFGKPSTFIGLLADASRCARDLPCVQQLGVNTIRVHRVVQTSILCTFMPSVIPFPNLTKHASINLNLTLPLNGSIDRSSPVCLLTFWINALLPSTLSASTTTSWRSPSEPRSSTAYLTPTSLLS